MSSEIYKCMKCGFVAATKGGLTLHNNAKHTEQGIKRGPKKKPVEKKSRSGLNVALRMGMGLAAVQAATRAFLPDTPTIMIGDLEIELGSSEIRIRVRKPPVGDMDEEAI